MSNRRAVLCVALIATAAACQDQLATPDSDATPDAPQLAQGGVPGPPSTLAIPTPPGPPPRVPVPLPPRAGPPAFLTQIVDVGAGGAFACALRSDGVAYCWGSAILGDGSLTGRSVAVEVSGPNRFVRLEVGDANACGLTATGEAWCWGDNSQGQLGAGLSTARALVPVAVAGGHRFTSLDIGLRTMCGVATDGVTSCWGSNQFGQLGTGTVGSFTNAPVPVLNSATLGFTSVQTGFAHTCALTGAGAVYCWGSSSNFGNGSLGPQVPSPTLAAGGATYASIAVGTFYGCGLDGSGAASCWGTSQRSGELGLGSIALNVLSPTLVVGGLSFAMLDAFDNNSVFASTCGLSTAGAAWCWGNNADGQLGAPSSDTCTFGATTFSCSATPVPVSGGLRFRKVAAGLRHACALDTAGNVWCWGNNSAGELGDGTMVSSMAPVRVIQLDQPEQIGWIEITPPGGQLQLIGTTLQFTAQALDENGAPLATQPPFAWSSSDPAAATVDPATGLATALATGATTITALAPDGSSARASLRVQIADPVAVFRDAWAGGTTDGMVVLGGLLADEWMHSGTFPTRLEVDQRTISTSNSTVQAAFARLAFARVALEHDAARLLAANPSDPTVGQLRALAGYVYLAWAENFCSGVPLDDPNVGESTGALFNFALARFAQALAGPIAPPFDLVARVGMARAQLGLGNHALAAAAAGPVPNGFTYGITHTAATGEQNMVYALSPQQKRLSVSDLEGTNGLAFRALADPRVPWTFAGLGFDNVTPNYSLLKYPSATTPTILASAVEARLIEAEAALSAGNVGGMVATLNALRAAAGLPSLTAPSTPAGQLDQLFSERAFWLFAQGNRLGDLRRLIGQYRRAPSAVFPVGPHHKGGSYGTDANLPVPASARGPAYSDCAIRTL